MGWLDNGRPRVERLGILRPVGDRRRGRLLSLSSPRARPTPRPGVSGWARTTRRTRARRPHGAAAVVLCRWCKEDCYRTHRVVDRERGVMNASNELLKVTHIADGFMVSPDAVRDWISKGLLPATKAGPHRGSHWVVKRCDLEAFVSSMVGVRMVSWAVFRRPNAVGKTRRRIQRGGRGGSPATGGPGRQTRSQGTRR